MSASVRDVAASCLDKTGTLSLSRDILGVYADDNPQDRSLLAQMDLIQNVPFVKVALVTIQDAAPTLQGDIDRGNGVYQSECNVWIYPTASITVVADHLRVLDQDDCASSGHSVSDEEDELFDLGRSLGANIVGYYIIGDGSGLFGCAAHPPGRRGFWVGNSASPWTWVHELTHVVGDNPHVDTDDSCNLSNLMTGCGTNNINVPSPDLNATQCERINDDDDVEEC